jgi:threonine dehydrogenase-like Zn-dependent dehydrogenase
MKSLVFSSGHLYCSDRTSQPALIPGYALIKIIIAGVCGTDIEITKGYADFHGVLGHEFMGIVEDVADDSDNLWVGKRVVGEINIGCMKCAVCLTHGTAHCPDRQVLGIRDKDGCFAEYITLPVCNLHVVPDCVSDESAVFTEPLAAACRIREQLLIDPAKQIAVVGCGRLGLLIGATLRLTGSEVTMLARRSESLKLPEQWGFSTALVDDYSDNSFDLVVEATGNESGLRRSIRLVKPLGTLVLKSTFQNTVNINLTKLVVAEITVTGSRCGAFAPALRLLEQGLIDVESTIDEQFPLKEGVAAMQYAATQGVRKVLLNLE